MARYVIRRLLLAVPVLLFVTLIVFLIMHLSPGDPVTIMLGGQVGVTQETMDAVRAKMGLDEPVYVQYFIWLRGVLQGDLGYSYLNHLPVSTMLAQKLPASAELAVASIFLALVVAIPGGVLAAVKRNSLLDRLLTTFVTAGIAIPGFWLAILIVLLFAVALDWLPSSGHVDFRRDPVGNLRFLVLPALTMSILLAAPIMRFVRSSMLDVLGEDYVRTARAKGLAERTLIYRHALRNAMIPTVTVVALQFAGLIGGAVLIEWVFAWPGIGWLAVNAISARDYSVVQGIVLVVAVIFVVANLIADLLYAALDPRIRYG